MARDLRAERVQNWYERARSRSRESGFEDLHVTAIDPTLKGAEAWYRAGLNLLLEVCRLRNVRAGNMTVALALTLQSGSQPLRDIPSGEEALQRVMDDITPPSVYLLAEDATELVNDAAARRLDQCPISVEDLKLRCYLREWMDPSDGEYRRVLWLTA
jgi:hypothetical protein